MNKKIIVLFLAAIMLVACSDSSATEEPIKNSKKEKKTEIVEKKVSIKEYEKRINAALKEMDDKTNLKLISTEKYEDGQTGITLSDNIAIFLETDKDNYIKKATLAMTPEAYHFDREDFDFALLLLVGTIDETLSFGDRNKIITKLGMSEDNFFVDEQTEFYTHNKISYMYQGSSKETMFLRAEVK